MTQYFSSIRGQVKRRLDYVEVAQFWKNPGIPFMIVSFAFNLSLLLFGGIIVFGKLPPKLQLFYNPVEQTWSPENKVIPVFIIPIILICLYLLQYRFLKVIFKTDRRLAIVISWLMTLLNTFLLIGITQIYSLNQA
ncbi:hypothetical protein KC678_04045 [Candidatus Dojkabacteria bacterium]|uniref:DUF1648 domain-containing protein n=1 Tax=Candidatus Dojkabacteria bacterium TaxID=2099670 RepID=A0A955L1Z7_9BACT|nr:hypothetical protein [Candidatus Dojkabacteria bacterium]